MIFRSSKKRKTNKSFTRRVTCKAKPDKWHKWCRKPIRYYNNKSITNSRNTTKKNSSAFWQIESENLHPPARAHAILSVLLSFCLSFWARLVKFYEQQHEDLFSTSKRKWAKFFRLCQLVKVRECVLIAFERISRKTSSNWNRSVFAKFRTGNVKKTEKTERAARYYIKR